MTPWGCWGQIPGGRGKARCAEDRGTGTTPSPHLAYLRPCAATWWGPRAWHGLGGASPPEGVSPTAALPLTPISPP